jgi:hypothetical protein
VGLLWETYQQVSNQHQDNLQDEAQQTMAQRLAWLEEIVRQQNQVLGMLIQQLEVRFGEDLNGDRRIG